MLTVPCNGCTISFRCRRSVNPRGVPVLIPTICSTFAMQPCSWASASPPSSSGFTRKRFAAFKPPADTTASANRSRQAALPHSRPHRARKITGHPPRQRAQSARGPHRFGPHKRPNGRGQNFHRRPADYFDHHRQLRERDAIEGRPDRRRLIKATEVMILRV